MLHGLHAAHEAKNERGEPLGIVHRDISPQNILVGVDGVPRVLDFGVAKAVGRVQTTREGQLKGKIGYMAPEQVEGRSRRGARDVYAAAVVLWEVLTGRRLITGETTTAMLHKVLTMRPEAPSLYNPSVDPALDAVVLRGLSRDPADRYASAREMATALEGAANVAIAPVVSAWVERTAGPELAAQAQRVAQMEHDSDASTAVPVPDPPPASVPIEPSRDSLAYGPLAHADTIARNSLTIPSEAPPEMSQLSQASSVSVAAPVTSTGGLGRRRGVAALGVVLFVAAIIGLLALRAHDPGAGAAAEASAAALPQAAAPLSPGAPPPPRLTLSPRSERRARGAGGPGGRGDGSRQHGDRPLATRRFFHQPRTTAPSRGGIAGGQARRGRRQGARPEHLGAQPRSARGVDRVQSVRSPLRWGQNSRVDEGGGRGARSARRRRSSS